MKITHCLLSLCLLFSLTGCIPLLVGTGVAGGLVLSVDTVRLDLDTTIEQAWEETRSVLSERGQVIFENESDGVIRARIGDTSVAAYVARVTYDSGDTSIWVDVSARRRALPNLDLAFEIINDIQGRF
ncbi:MAG: hypothetical protein JXD21_08380 [Candidatus Omnitrophica bacterium]|nr:hypothetical protein [Candidatus Omnitrophota bacterium]